jgi:hypothetical protein
MKHLRQNANDSPDAKSRTTIAPILDAREVDLKVNCYSIHAFDLAQLVVEKIIRESRHKDSSPLANNT